VTIYPLTIVLAFIASMYLQSLLGIILAIGGVSPIIISAIIFKNDKI